MENIPTTGDEILQGKYSKHAREEAGDKESKEDQDPPAYNKRRGKMQGEEEIRRNKIGKEKQQRFMIDWMKSGEKGNGGHTCKLGMRVRTGGIVMKARRQTEGLIILRVWHGVTVKVAA